MKNSDRLAQINTFDLLCRMNDNITRLDAEVCILDFIAGKMSMKCDLGIDVTGYKDRCGACIAQWLNAEYDGRW